MTLRSKVSTVEYWRTATSITRDKRANAFGILHLSDSIAAIRSGVVRMYMYVYVRIRSISNIQHLTFQSQPRQRIFRPRPSMIMHTYRTVPHVRRRRYEMRDVRVR